MTGHNAPITGLACTTIDRCPVAISGSEDRTVRVWDLLTRESVDVSPLWKSVEALTVSDDGRYVVVGARWDLAVLTTTGQPLGVSAEEAAFVGCDQTV
jgi:WD40 repeat protein